MKLQKCSLTMKCQNSYNLDTRWGGLIPLQTYSRYILHPASTELYKYYSLYIYIYIYIYGCLCVCLCVKNNTKTHAHNIYICVCLYRSSHTLSYIHIYIFPCTHTLFSVETSGEISSHNILLLHATGRKASRQRNEQHEVEWLIHHWSCWPLSMATLLPSCLSAKRDE